MIRNLREKELPTKQEGGIVDDKTPTSSRLWSGLKNPRIFRVSRAFGGKDRHSKVSTVRGLRDRRVRLSVPTAIQLYDLQDRLGLNQPSKVVDWLLNATQHEIDKLPPLQMPPGNIQFSQSFVTPHEATPLQSPSHPAIAKNTGYINENGACPLVLLSSKANSENLGDAVVAEDLATLPNSTYWNSDASQRNKEREAPRELGIEKCNIMKGNGVEIQDVGVRSSQVQAHDPLLKPTHSSLSGLLTTAMPYSSYYYWEPSNAYASHMGTHSSQMEVPPTSIPSSLSLTPGSQLVLCPSGAIPSVFPSYMAASTDFEQRQFTHFQMASSAQNLSSNPMITYLHSGSPTMRHFHSNLASKHHHSQDHHES